jgi:hypothetical protein
MDALDEVVEYALNQSVQYNYVEFYNIALVAEKELKKLRKEIKGLRKKLMQYGIDPNPTTP